ncbi:hypothetical protein GF373_15185, partial [bacterium]|nr:hypothetical protein [bacterium]
MKKYTLQFSFLAKIMLTALACVLTFSHALAVESSAKITAMSNANGIVNATKNDRPPYPGSLQLPTRGHAWPGPETFRIGNAIAPINYWMTAWMLNDVMKMAGFEAEVGNTQPSVMWIPIIEGQWQMDRRYDIPLDQHGWPTSMKLNNGTQVDRYTTVAMGDKPSPQAFPKGEYRLTYHGEGHFRFDGANVVSEGAGEIILHYNGQKTLMISITKTDPNNHLRNIRLLRPDAVAGERFHREYLDYLRPFSVIRPLHFLGEQLSYGPYANWEERKPVDYSHWGGAFGSPYEIAIDLANQSASDLWLNIPIAADDRYVRNLARLMQTGLDPERRLYLELGNELWNYSFPYALGRQYALKRAQERWPNVLGKVKSYSDGDKVSENMMIFSWQGARTVEIRKIFHEVWGDEADRLIAVLAGQIGGSFPNWYPSRALLECPVGVGEEGLEPSGRHVDAFAVAPYIGEEKGVMEFDRSSPKAFFAEAIAYVRGEGPWNESGDEPGLRYSIRSDKRMAEGFGLPLIT